MAENDILVPRENAAGGFDERVLTAADIGAAPASHTHTASAITDLSTSGNAAGLYDNTAGQVGAVVNDFSLRINGDGVSADLDTANLTASRAYSLPNASGALALNPLTTAGDLFVGGTSGAPARLALGTASQQLRVNSGATALEYFTSQAIVSNTTGITGADAVTNMVSLTQAEYNAIGSPDAATLYLITDP